MDEDLQIFTRFPVVEKNYIQFVMGKRKKIHSL